MIDYNIIIDRFLNITDVIGNPDEGYKYDAINHFQTNWNLESPDFYLMFKTAFAKKENLFYQNSWGFIDKCAEHFPEITRTMFRHLYEENADLDIRIINFQNKSNELLAKLKSQLSRDNLNAQQDERTISVYLGFRYPEKYIFYMFSFYGRLAKEFNLVGDFREKKNYLKLLSLLPDFKKVVKERGDFVERYRSFYSAPSWDDANLMIQNILYVGYRFDLDGIHDRSLLHFSKNELLNYYQILDQLIERFNLQKKDYRFVFNVSEKQLNFTVGQKYVWCLKSKNKVNRYRAIANEKFGQSIEIFNSEANKFLNDTDDFKLINKNFELIASAIDNELEKTKKSGYYKFNSEFFERMAFDKEFRALILEKVVAENDDSHYYIISEYEEWYLEKYGKRLDSIIYTMIYGFLYQIEKQELVGKYELDHYNHSTIHCLINEIPNFKYDGLDVFELFLQNLLQKTNMITNSLNQILYGPPGTGKTHKIHSFINLTEKNKKIEKIEETIKVNRHKIFWHLAPGQGGYLWKDLKKGSRLGYEWCSMSLGNLKDLDKNTTENYKMRTYFSDVKKGDYFCIISGKKFYGIAEALEDYDFSKVAADGFDFQTVEVKWIKIFDTPELLSTSYTPTFGKLNGGKRWSSLIQGLEVNNIVFDDEINEKKQVKKISHNYIFTTFHQSFSYEDFIEGIKPNLEDSDEVSYNIEDGIFKVACDKAANLAGFEDLNDALESSSEMIKAKFEVSEPFYLFIDEINRGNVSQIFGELITLIEESKRLGNPEELKVTLPYSKKEFGVPSNLYIIGTMNTADRSVEALDSALRRRFSFVEMMPDSSIVEDCDFTDYQRVDIMEKINQRIELLLDRNYTLGHSYFIKDDFKASFRNEIIPLLQEYFYSDCGKIGLILGRGFVREKEISKVNHQTIFADFDTRNEIEVIKSYELIPFEEVDFENALDLLLA